MLCDAMRSWGVSSREDFAEWMHRQGFVRPAFQWQDSRKNSERSCRQGRQGDRFESFYVHLIMQACSSERAAAPLEVGPRVTADRAPAVGETQWNCLDDIIAGSDEIQGVAELSPHLKEKYRVALTTALEAVHEAAQRRDPVKEVRVWKLFRQSREG